MTDSEPLGDVIARLQERMRPHAVTPEPLKRRRVTDAAGPAGGDSGSMLAGVPLAGVRGDSSRQRIRRPGTDRDATFRPDAVHFANNPVPATARVPQGSVSRTQVPGKLTRRSDNTGETVMRGRRPLTDPATGVTVHRSDLELYATHDSADAAARAWVSARSNLARDAGEVLPAGSMYPSRTSRLGNLGPSARY